jgi:phosphoglycerate dehydrogenase-like enzyme
VEFVEAYDPDDVLREIADAEVVFGYVRGNEFENAHSLRWVNTPDAGMELLFDSVPGISGTDVIVTNAQGAGAPQIGEHALSLILAFSRGLDQFMAKQRRGEWAADYGLTIVQLIQGKTAGIIGLGKSGVAIAWRCKAMGMKVIGIDKFDVDAEPAIEDVWSLSRLPELLAESDYVIVTVPYSPENENMLGAAELALMKPTARLIVTSRGRLVEHNALVAALRNGEIAGAGLDVTVEEPLPAENELWGMDNVIITPHIAGNSPELDERTLRQFEENLHRYLNNEPLRNVVDKNLHY